MPKSESGRLDWSIDIMNDNRLNAVAEEGNIDKLYTLIQNDPHILDHFDTIPFVQTPLHVAASTKHLKFAGEIMRLKPSFAFKPNPQGLCPIHLALEAGRNTIEDHDQPYRMALLFVDINKDLVRVKGKEGLTPLHWASQFGEIGLILNFQRACPNSIEDVTVRCETALHIALKHKQVLALSILVDWLKRNTNRDALDVEKEVLNRKDDDGNTILHIATLGNNVEAVKLLIKSPMNLNAKNLERKAAIEITDSEDIKRILARSGAWSPSSPLPRSQFWFYVIMAIFWKILSLLSSIRNWVIRKTRLRGYMTEHERSAYLVAATLVATATYQAALSPPGGLYQTDAGSTNDSTLSHSSSINWKRSIGNEGNSIMSNSDFILFTSTNMISFMASTFAIFGLLPRNVACPLLFVPTFLLQLSYFFSMMVISPTRATTILVVCIFVILDGIFTVVGPIFMP